MKLTGTKKRLEGLSKKYLKASLKAMKELLAHYKGEMLVDTCPLCPASPMENDDGCYFCPWRVMTGKDCNVYKDTTRYKEFCVGVLRGYTFKEGSAWAKLRIKQLTSWIEFYEMVLEDRK